MSEYEALNQQKKELEMKLQAIKELIADVDSAIAELDEVEGIPLKPDWESEDPFCILSAPGNDVKFGRIFKSTDLANQFKESIDRIAKLLHCKRYLDREYVPDWSNEDEAKFVVVFDHYHGSYQVDECYSYDQKSVYFSSYEIAKKAASWMQRVEFGKIN